MPSYRREYKIGDRNPLPQKRKKRGEDGRMEEM